MGKILKIVAVVAVAALVAYYAPQLSAALVHAGLTTSAAAAVTAVAAAVVTLGAGAIVNALAAKPSTSATPSIFRQAISNSFIIYGKRRAGGLLCFFHPVGKKLRYFVIAVAGHRCKGVVTWYLNDEVVTVNATTGAVTSGTYAGNAWLWFYRGTDDQIAHPTFVAETGGKWTTDHRGRGVALIYAKFNMADTVVQAGMPNITAEIEGKDDIFDPRSGAVGYTRNGALVFDDWMKLAREEGGFGGYPDEFDDDWTASQAQRCDEDVPLKAGGTEKRYELDAYITTGAAPSEVRDGLVLCCAGSYTYSGGKHLMRPGYYVPPTAILKEEDLAGAFTVPALLPGDQICTEVAGTYVDPANLYQPGDVPTRAVAGADTIQKTVDLPHITSGPRGQRICEIILRQTLAERRVTWPMNIAGLAISTLQTVQCATSRYGLSNYAFQVGGWTLAQDFSVQLQLAEHNADIFDWDVSMELVAVGSGTLDRVDASAGPDAPADGSWAVAAMADPAMLVVTGARDDDSATGVVLEYRIDGAAIWTSAGSYPADVTRMEIKGLAVGTTYDVAVSYSDSSGSGERLELPAITIVSTGQPPGADTMLSATGGSGAASIAWRNSTSSNFGWSVVYRSATNNFAAASDISGHIVGGLGQMQQVTDTVAAGSYFYWVRPFANDGTPATSPTGPATAIVS